MADPIFERYKEALKQGHVAVFRGRHEEALAHYEEAARMAGHRPLPFVSIGSVLLQLGRARDALVAFDEALRRAPDDRAALSGKADALARLGRSEEAEELHRYVAGREAEEAQREAEFAAAQAAALATQAAAQAAQAATRAAVEAAAWASGAEQLMMAGSEALARGDRSGALGAFIAASATYQERMAFDAALDACQRALMIAGGSPAVHLAMASVYLRRGWLDLGEERLVLLDHLLSLDEDREARYALRELARAYLGLAPSLGTLVAPAWPEADRRVLRD